MQTNVPRPGGDARRLTFPAALFTRQVFVVFLIEIHHMT
jgi:hypothetical protein